LASDYWAEKELAISLDDRQDVSINNETDHRLRTRVQRHRHAGSDAAGTRLNTATQFRNVGLAHHRPVAELDWHRSLIPAKMHEDAGETS